MGWLSPSSSAEETGVSDTFTLTLSCPNRTGIVRAVSGFLYDRGCDIGEHQQFDDKVRGRLFMRTQVTAPEGTTWRSCRASSNRWPPSSR